MEFLFATALGGAVAALFTDRADASPAAHAAHLGAVRIPLRAAGRSPEETVARLDAMIRALDSPRR